MKGAESPFDHAETERLVRGYEEHQKKHLDAVTSAAKAQKASDDALHEAQRWEKALNDHFEMVKASARLRAKGERG